jgi:hypothetical protein
LNFTYVEEMNAYIGQKEDKMKELVKDNQKQLEGKVNEYYRLDKNPSALIDEYLQKYLCRKI